MALNMFQHDKTASTREKDLLRIMKVCLYSAVSNESGWFNNVHDVDWHDVSFYVQVFTNIVQVFTNIVLV